MAPKEIYGIPFRMVSHLAMEDEHVTGYVAKGDWPFDLRMCVHAPIGDSKPSRRTTRHFMLNGKVYKTRKALYKAMEKY